MIGASAEWRPRGQSFYSKAPLPGRTHGSIYRFYSYHVARSCFDFLALKCVSASGAVDDSMYTSRTLDVKPSSLPMAIPLMLVIPTLSERYRLACLRMLLQAVYMTYDPIIEERAGVRSRSNLYLIPAIVPGIYIRHQSVREVSFHDW